MTKVINWIMDWVRNPNKRQFLLLVVCVLIAMFYFRSCQKQSQLKDEMKKQALINEQNTRALTDSVRYVKNKAGDIEAIKSSFISKLSDLEKLNKDLYLETKKEMGTLKSLIKTGLVADGGGFTVSNDLYKYPDNRTFGLRFEKTLADSGMTWSLKGESKFLLDNNNLFPGSTTIFENKVKMKLVLGFKEAKNGDYEVFARSGSPLITFNELDGVLIIPKKPDITTPVSKKKRFGIGPQIGVGVTTDMSGNLRLGGFVGFGLSYSLLQF